MIPPDEVAGSDPSATTRIYLVTGVSGAGKTAVARRLRDWGHEAVSLDADTRLCGWIDQAGRRVQRPDAPYVGWLATHRWAWDATRLDELVDEMRRRSVTTAWFCGQAANAIDLADRFDACFLLDIDQQTMRQRMLGESRGNDFGRVGDTLQAALASHLEFMAVWRRHGSHTIDATQLLDRVVEDLLMASAQAAQNMP